MILIIRPSNNSIINIITLQYVNRKIKEYNNMCLCKRLMKYGISVKITILKKTTLFSINLKITGMLNATKTCGDNNLFT